jgi:hypothetical protein
VQGPEARTVDRETQIELKIVESGIRRDQDMPEAAVLALQVPELDDGRLYPWSARLQYAYADALLSAGRDDDAYYWFGRAAAADQQGETDAGERFDELDEITIEDLAEPTDEDLPAPDDSDLPETDDEVQLLTATDDEVAETDDEDLSAAADEEPAESSDEVLSPAGDANLAETSEEDHPVLDESVTAIDGSTRHAAIEMPGSEDSEHNSPES